MKKPTRVIGLLIESSRGAGRDLLSGIRRFVDGRPDWSVYWSPSGFNDVGAALDHIRLDGLIARDVLVTEKLTKLGIPTVVVSHGKLPAPDMLQILTDCEAIGRLAAEHLLGCGFPHFAYVGIPGNPPQTVPSWSEARRESFVAHLREAGYACATPPDPGDVRWSEPEVISDWLSSLPKPLGCMAANDDRASQVAHACKMAGLRVPEQIGIIGVDDDELVCTFCDPALSSVAVSFERAGNEAAQCLAAWIDSGQRPPNLRPTPPAFVAARRSTDMIAVADANIANALRYIRSHLRDGRLSVSDVARAAGLSRRTLERRFRQATARSIQDHIRHLRVDEITRAVVVTDMPTVKIARSLGFDDVRHFSRYFRSIQGMSPLEYRQHHQPLLATEPKTD